MALPLEDHALIGDTYSAALVGKDGSIDWLCWPRFDSDACFAALLGDERHGSWRMAPAVTVRTSRRTRAPSVSRTSCPDEIRRPTSSASSED